MAKLALREAATYHNSPAVETGAIGGKRPAASCRESSRPRIHPKSRAAGGEEDRAEQIWISSKGERFLGSKSGYWTRKKEKTKLISPVSQRHGWVPLFFFLSSGCSGKKGEEEQNRARLGRKERKKEKKKRTEQEVSCRQQPSLEEKPKFQICSALSSPPAALGVGANFSDFWISRIFPCTSRRLFPKLQFRFCWKIVVLDSWGILVSGLSLRYYRFEETKSRMGKNEGSDELEG
ncbi:hypothetical protein SLEP1_g9429 [Rubroshorea leprosula]|uniref:Uncharacterized protein n=1 Tax=Rubroshorea leprosula TaxID=152421 RepID=A0AAV5IAW7_9ROSI|nr:hypothetical protein SLEP1_g9429 [Rubroshorea leprosula]